MSSDSYGEDSFDRYSDGDGDGVVAGEAAAPIPAAPAGGVKRPQSAKKDKKQKRKAERRESQRREELERAQRLRENVDSRMEDLYDEDDFDDDSLGGAGVDALRYADGDGLDDEVANVMRGTPSSLDTSTRPPTHAQQSGSSQRRTSSAKKDKTGKKKKKKNKSQASLGDGDDTHRQPDGADATYDDDYSEDAEFEPTSGQLGGECGGRTTPSVHLNGGASPDDFGMDAEAGSAGPGMQDTGSTDFSYPSETNAAPTGAADSVEDRPCVEGYGVAAEGGAEEPSGGGPETPSKKAGKKKKKSVGGDEEAASSYAASSKGEDGKKGKGGKEKDKDKDKEKKKKKKKKKSVYLGDGEDPGLDDGASSVASSAGKAKGKKKKKKSVDMTGDDSGLDDGASSVASSAGKAKGKKKKKKSVDLDAAEGPPPTSKKSKKKAEKQSDGESGSDDGDGNSLLRKLIAQANDTDDSDSGSGSDAGGNPPPHRDSPTASATSARRGSSQASINRKASARVVKASSSPTASTSPSTPASSHRDSAQKDTPLPANDVSRRTSAASSAAQSGTTPRGPPMEPKPPAEDPAAAAARSSRQSTPRLPTPRQGQAGETTEGSTPGPTPRSDTSHASKGSKGSKISRDSPRGPAAASAEASAPAEGGDEVLEEIADPDAPPAPAEAEGGVEAEAEAGPSSTRSVKVVAPQEEDSATPTPTAGGREEAMAERIRELERQLDAERRSRLGAEGAAEGGGAAAPKVQKPQRPHSAPSGRLASQSAALIRRSEAAEAPPNFVHAFRPRHALASHHSYVPSRRERHASVHLGDNIYIFGGRNGSGAAASRGDLDPNLYAFNVHTAAWKKLSTSGPRPTHGRYGHSACIWHGSLPWSDPSEPQTESMIIFGGYGPALPSAYNTDGRGLDYGGHGSDVSPRGGRVASGSHVGGMGYCRDILSLDLETKKWTRVSGDCVTDALLWGREAGMQGGGGSVSPEAGGEPVLERHAQLPERDLTAVRGHSAVIYARRLWVFGGIREGGHVSSHLDTLHLKKMKWVPLRHTPDTKPHGVFGHTAVVWGGSMWVYGGQNSDNDRVASVCAFNFSVGMWSHKECGGDVPPARSGHASQVYRQSMIVFGGATGHMEYAQDCHVLNLGSLIWERVDLTFPPGSFGRRNLSFDAMVCAEEAEEAADGTASACNSPAAEAGRVADAANGHPASGDSEHGSALCAPQVLNVRCFAFGGGGDAEHTSNYNVNQYHCTNDMLVLDFPGGWPHAGRCDAKSTADHEPVDTGAAARPVSVQLPMRYSRFEPWRIQSAFEPVAPMLVQKGDKRLSEDEIAKMSERLYVQTVAQREKKLQELRNKLVQKNQTKRLTKDEEERAVNRMYHQQLDRAKQKQSQLSARFMQSQPKVAKMDSKKIEASVHRLHEQAVQHRQETMRRLHGQMVQPKTEGKKLDRSERERVNKGLYYERVETEKVRKAKLMDKYLHSAPQSASRHRTRAEEVAVTDRLFKGEAFVSPT